MSSEIRRSSRLKDLEKREQIREGKRQERPPSALDFVARKLKRGRISQQDTDQGPEQEKIEFDNSSVKEECKPIFKSAFKEMQALYRQLRSRLRQSGSTEGGPSTGMRPYSDSEGSSSESDSEEGSHAIESIVELRGHLTKGRQQKLRRLTRCAKTARSLDKVVRKWKQGEVIKAIGHLRTLKI